MKELIRIETPWEPLTDEDFSIVWAQLGRRPEGAIGVAVRCRYGRPQVIASAPLRVDGKAVTQLPTAADVRSVSVFPTLYWLTCPMLQAAIGRLESAGWIARLREELEADPAAAQELDQAHRRTARMRTAMIPEATLERLRRDFPGQARVLTESGVAGMRDRRDRFAVKCLHAHFADYLATGENPVGRRVWALLTSGGVDPRGLGPCFARNRQSCPGSPPDLDGPQAVIDVGSNSVRLLVARRVEGGWQRLAEELITTRLGAAVAENGLLSSQAIDRTVEALRRLAAQAARFGAANPLAIATSAVREAANRDVLLVRAWEEAGVPLRVISGEEEGELSFRGALTGLHVAEDTPVVMCDVGGGSTELIVGEGSGRVQHVFSLPYGAVRLAAQQGQREGVQSVLSRLRSDLGEVVRKAAPDVTFRGREATLLCVGGTATTLAALDLRLSEYEPERINGYALTGERLEDWLDRLWWMDVEERKQLPGMPAGRADIMPFGLAILSAVAGAWSKWTGDRLVVSDNDLLYGALLRL